jgi:hypothetical protein
MSYAKEELGDNFYDQTLFSQPKNVYSWGVTGFKMFGVSMDLVTLHQEIIIENSYVCSL